jgi:bacillithiol biosynthesis deacetylase BshB1
MTEASGDRGGYPKLDLLAFGAHPDDVELACGGTLALLAARGRKVGIVHLTRGEAGTRGTAAARRHEAEAAARELGADALEILDCGDGELRHGRAEEDAVLAVLRRYRPEAVLGPPPADRHPDHGRAHRLVADACFYAGLAGRTLTGADAALAPHRPAAFFHYMQHDSFEPDFVVDVSTVWERKTAALACYGSQLQVPDAWGSGELGGGPAQDAPLTKVATREFSLAVEGRARHYGLLVGAALGEPFGSSLPLAVADPLAVLPGGVR